MAHDWKKEQEENLQIIKQYEKTPKVCECCGATYSEFWGEGTLKEEREKRKHKKSRVLISGEPAAVFETHWKAFKLMMWFDHVEECPDCFDDDY